MNISPFGFICAGMKGVCMKALQGAGGDLQNAKPFVTNPAFSWLAIGLCVLFLLLVFSRFGLQTMPNTPSEVGMDSVSLRFSQAMIKWVSCHMEA